MYKTLLFCLLCWVASQSWGNDRGEIMLLGTFHFDNPGLDVVKSDVLDVTSAENQRYLEALSLRLASYQPEVVMLEFDPKNHDSMNQKYQQYLAGGFELPPNETYQIGFRVAKQAGLKTIHSFDERAIGWQGDALFTYIKDHDPALGAQLQEKINWHSEQSNHDQRTMSLAALLHQHNDAAFDQLNKGFYLLTNAAGDGQNFVGADAAASWWHRNFRMYAKLQRQALQGKRVFAIAGQGHTAIIKDLLAADENIKGVDVNPYISAPE